MNKRDELIVKYVKDLKDKFDIDADTELLKKVTIGLGPSIYNLDSSTVSSSDAKEIETVRSKYLIGKLGLEDTEALDQGISDVLERYGRTNRTKYRAVVYYLLVKHFGKESIYR
ncbi:DUF2853 family protein [Winogradskyella aurantiaca]|uniref:DUF2853 family protein n=1 Tax=Winogradskyella aurantiaca TaxID=2219558 RepID=UPI000E1CE1C0|nr:DUF2853 family protein [Winogradskyella aurantiaca]